MVYEGLIMGLLGNIGSFLGKVGSNVGGWLKNNASSLASGVGGIGSTFISNATSKGAQARAYNYARQLQQQQYDLTLQGYRESPSAQRQGMELAGFNPMLALGNVGNGVSVAGGTPVNGNATDVSGTQQAISQAVQLKNQTKQIEASSDEAYANADKAKAEKAILMQRLPFVSERERLENAKLSWESQKMESEIHYNNEFLNLLRSRQELDYQLGLMSNATQRYSADTAYNAIRYSSDKSYDASRYGSDNSYLSNIYSADKAYNAATYRSWSDHYRNFGIGTGAILHGSTSVYDRYDGYRRDNARRRVGF